MAKDKKPLFQQVAEKLVEQLEKGTSPFQQDWTNIAFKPFNPTTNKEYRGMNSIWLMMHGHRDPRWLTFKQAAASGWSIEKGTKGTVINYYKFQKKEKKLDENGKPVLDEKGKQKYVLVRLRKPIITSAYVFNAEKVNGIPALPEIGERKWADLKRVEKIIKESQAKLRHGGNDAYYNFATDQITMPQKKQFGDAGKYYATLLHELGHWSGHPDRLNRETLVGRGLEAYAKEELRAEIASLMLEGDLNVKYEFSKHAAYVKSWVSILTDEPLELLRASSDAQKIRDYILGFDNKRQFLKGSGEKAYDNGTATDRLPEEDGQQLTEAEQVESQCIKPKR